MARPAYLSASNTNPSLVYTPNLHVTPFNIGLGAIVTSGAPTYRVEHTFDNVFASTFNPATATWFPHASLNNVVNQNADGNYAFPIQGLRVRVTSGTGAVQLTVLQAGVKQ
jgi:hypothetical protein